jgi:hypothetical protein
MKRLSILVTLTLSGLAGPACNGDGANGPSPADDRIAFASERDGNREIYVMNADGTNDDPEHDVVQSEKTGQGQLADGHRSAP